MTRKSKKIKTLINKKRKRLLPFLIGPVFVLGIAFFVMSRNTETAQAWFNDNWQYRVRITFGNSGAATTDEKVKFDIDTSTPIGASKMQSDCADVRFTNASGKVLPHFLDTSGGACNTASTDFYVLFENIVAGDNVAYMYYGNPSAVDIGAAANFSQATFAPTSGPSTGSEQTTPGPVAHWKLDEGADNTCSGGTNDMCDSTSQANDGALTGATWKSRSFCMSGNCLYFDGTSDYVSVSDVAGLDIGAAGSFTVQAWVRKGEMLTGTETILSKYETTGADGGYELYFDGSGDLNFGIDTDNSGFPLDVASSTTADYDDNEWHHVVGVKDGSSNLYLYIDGNLIATDSSITASSVSNGDPLYIGSRETGTNQFDGFIDEIKIYPYARSAAEIRSDFISRGGGASGAELGANNESFLSEGLVGYWPLDESSGNASDYSGNSQTLTNSGTTTFVTGKYGSGSEHVPASSQHFSYGSTISNLKTVSFWTNPDSTTNYYIALTSSAYITSSSGTLSATGFSNPKIYVNGVETTTIAANSWQLVTVTDTTAINANAFYLGRQSTNYFDGTMDELRLYNRVLSPGEIITLYSWGPPPVAHYTFD